MRLTVRLTPRAGRSGPDGIRVGADGLPVLRLRLAAPPVDGAANAALVTLVARGLGLRQRDVTIRSGERSRTKSVFLAGEPGEIARRLDGWLADAGALPSDGPRSGPVPPG